MLELNNIYLGDCLEVLKSIEDDSVDLVVTDPPYLIKGNGFASKSGFLKDRKIFEDLQGIRDGFDFNVLFELGRVLKRWNCYIYCNKDLLFELIVWFKENTDAFLDVLVEEITNPTPFCNHTYLNNLDYILYVRESGVQVNGTIKNKTKIRVKSTNKADKEKYHHPTPKYVPILEEYIRNSSSEGDTVLDCFSGSGSLAIACHNTNRNFICIEKDETYYQSSVKRLKTERSRKKLF